MYENTGLRLIDGNELVQWERRVGRRTWFLRVMGVATASVVVAAHHYYPEDTKHVATVMYNTTKEWIFEKFQKLKNL